jgi:hypothetical protein
MKLRSLIPNSYIHVSVSDLYIPWIGLILAIYKSLTASGNWETERYKSDLEITRPRCFILGIHKLEPNINIVRSPDIHLQCEFMVSAVIGAFSSSDCHEISLASYKGVNVIKSYYPAVQSVSHHRAGGILVVEVGDRNIATVHVRHQHRHLAKYILINRILWKNNLQKYALKVLSSEMDPTEIRLIRYAFNKERGVECGDF